MTKNPRHWSRSVLSLLLVLCLMPLGHALMVLMEHTIARPALHYCAFAMGAAGVLLAVWGIFVKGDTRQTFFGLIGGLLFWTGWVEFLFQYYALRYGTQPEINAAGEIVTKPEYLILPATFGLWMMVMLIYTFSSASGCLFYNWVQHRLLGNRKSIVVQRPMTRHVSIVTFMEFCMIMWTSYLLLMFCYDARFLGDAHPVTLAVGAGCFIGAIAIFARQLRLNAWGPNIRMSIATVVTFWIPVEIMGRNNLFKEIWIHPMDYALEMGAILSVFLALCLWVVVKELQRRRV